MPRAPNSTANKAANKDGSCKSTKKYPGGSKPVRHRRSVAGCWACRIRGKPCDQQLPADAYDLTTCKNCSDLKIACIGGFGERKVPNDQWKLWFRQRVKLYNWEAGKIRGVKGWTRSRPNLRKTPLSLNEIYGFVDSHRHLSREERDDHVNCIYHKDGICPGTDLHHTDRQYAQFPMSPATDISSDFPSTPVDFPDSPIIPLGHLGEAPLFEPTSPPPQYHDANAFSFNAPTQHFVENYALFAAPAMGCTESYNVGSPDTEAFSSQSSLEEEMPASQPTISDPALLEVLITLLQTPAPETEDNTWAGFTQGVFDEQA